MRRATPDDADRLSELDCLLFDNSFNERTIRIELEEGAGWVEGDPIVGYVMIRRDEDIIDITRLGVHPSFQGQRIGERLLLQALHIPGPHYLMVKKNNERALKLYKKYGFKVISGMPSSWIMVRELTEALI